MRGRSDLTRQDRRRFLSRTKVALSLALAWMSAAASAGVLCASAEELAISAKQDAPFRYEADGRRDPFRWLVDDAGKFLDQPKMATRNALDPMLYGILWDPDGKSIALINDAEARVGDTVDGFTVREIYADRVVLADESGDTREIRLEFDELP